MRKNKTEEGQRRFEENLELFAQNNPKAVIQLEHLSDDTTLSTTPTWANEPNLYHNIHKFFLHSKQNAAWEAKHWFEGLHFDGAEALFVFGIGLGYYFKPLQEWLRSNPNRIVIFIEDDLYVIEQFLHTDLAPDLLNHPQVIVKYFDTPNDAEWGKFREEFAWIFSTFAMIPTVVSALNSYAEFREGIYKKISNQIQFNLADKKEFLSYFREKSQKEIFTNFYYNLPYINQSKCAHTFFGNFEQVPAIICGAGPSLSKHFDQLKHLQDKALIFGAGSALNALTAHGVQPHFAAGVDPTLIQEDRIRSNQAFTVPFFYRMRFNSGAFQEIQSPKIYVACGDDPYSTDWFEKEWGIISPHQIVAGTSTTHFCLKVAEALGCNPIILVGMDLSYASGKQYSHGIEAHASSGNQEREQITHQKNSLISVKGIAEPTVASTWSWIQEASLYTHFHLENPSISLINATEGGMSIWQIPNQALCQVKDTHLMQNFDLEGRIQALLSIDEMKGLSQNQILATIEVWLESLKLAEEKCKSILEALENSRDVALSIKKGSWNKFQGDFHLHQLELEETIVYREFFNRIETIYQQMTLRDQYLFKKKSPDETDLVRKLKTLELEIKHYQYLCTHIQIHRVACQGGVESFLEKRESLTHKVEKVCEDLHFQESYWIKDGIYHLEDKELGICYHQPFHAEEKEVKNELFRGVSYYQNGNLHGPSRYYNALGQLISEIWYINGKKEGKSRFYNTLGILLRQSSFKNGLLEGKQFDFFENGFLKSKVAYHNGLTDGEALFYFANGQLRHQAAYKAGKLDGLEQFWDVDGHLIIESDYLHGVPCKISRRWNSHGQLIREVIYGKNGMVLEIKEWDFEK